MFELAEKYLCATLYLVCSGTTFRGSNLFSTVRWYFNFAPDHVLMLSSFILSYYLAEHIEAFSSEPVGKFLDSTSSDFGMLSSGCRCLATCTVTIRYEVVTYAF